MELNQILCNQITSVMKHFRWFYETLLLNLLLDLLEWFAEPTSRLVEMVWRDKYLYMQVRENKLASV